MKYIFALLFAVGLQAAMAQNGTTTNGIPSAPIGAPLTVTPTGANTTFNNTYQSGNTGLPNNSIGTTIVTPPIMNTTPNYGSTLNSTNINTAPVITNSTTGANTTPGSTTTAPQNLFNNSLNGSPQNLLNGGGVNTNSYDFMNGGTIYSGYGTTSPSLSNY